MKNFMILRNAATLCAAFCLVPTVTLAQSTPPPLLFVSIGDKPAILYDGLSTKANKIFILSRFRPVEVLVKLDKWTKVRDADNAIGWMENSFIGDKRYVQVSSNLAEIRVAPNATAGVIFEAQRAVILEATGMTSTDGWLPVRHRDGQNGFVRTAQVWGT